MSNNLILTQLGQRIARYRLNQNISQQSLANEAGISKPTLQRMENGHSSQTANLIRVLRALDLLDNFNNLIPEPAPSPIQQAKMHGKIRQRASSRTEQTDPVLWSWGDGE